jgi:hypothetical protein
MSNKKSILNIAATTFLYSNVLDDMNSQKTIVSRECKSTISKAERKKRTAKKKQAKKSKRKS